MKIKKTGGIKFSIPYNGDIDLVKWAVDSGQVHEVYFAGAKGSYFGAHYYNLKPHSGREISVLISFCNKNKIKTNLLLNKNSSFFDDVHKIVRYIGILEKDKAPDSITISDMFLLPFIRSKFPNMRFQSSVSMGIDSMVKAEEALKAGISELGLEPSVNRNAVELSKIARLKNKYPGISVKLLGIHGCYANCLYLRDHNGLADMQDVLMASGFKDKKYILGAKINYDRCFYKVVSTCDELKRPFIRPEDISYYELHRLADYIKIAYRNESSRLLKDKLSAYFQRSYDGNLFYLFESNKHRKMWCNNKSIPRDFIAKVMNCDKDCKPCGYCDDLAKKYVKVAE